MQQDKLRKQLEDMHSALVSGLITRLKNQDECTSADRSLAWQILKDNDVMKVVLGGTGYGEGQNIVARLPFTGQQDELEAAQG